MDFEMRLAATRRIKSCDDNTADSTLLKCAVCSKVGTWL